MVWLTGWPGRQAPPPVSVDELAEQIRQATGVQTSPAWFGSRGGTGHGPALLCYAGWPGTLPSVRSAHVLACEHRLAVVRRAAAPDLSDGQSWVACCSGSPTFGLLALRQRECVCVRSDYSHHQEAPQVMQAQPGSADSVSAGRQGAMLLWCVSQQAAALSSVGKRS